MKILFVADVSLARPSSGAEQVLYQQATGLAREDMDVLAITRQKGRIDWFVRNIDGVQEGFYCADPQRLKRFLLTLIKIPSKIYSRFVQDGEFDAVICHQPFTCFALLIQRKLTALPVIYVFHSPSHEEYLLSCDDSSRVLKLTQVILRRLIEGICLKSARKIVVLSDYMRNKAATIHRIHQDLIMVNPGGVDLTRFNVPNNRPFLKNNFCFPDGKIHLFTLRNLEPRMGVDVLIRSIRILKDEHLAIHLTIGGEGIERNRLERLVQELNLINEVTFTGFIPPELLPKYYGAADFFILPSQRLEGFGLVTPESLACGTPVLGTPIGGTVEILSKFNPDLLLKNTSQEALAAGIKQIIRQYFDNNEKYLQLRQGCRRCAENHYSWKRHIKSLISAIHQAVT
jgi:glycosyltransferase involved in cell wall biosynthesis